MSGYQKPVAGPGLRLHLNENTKGCSPYVLQRLRQLDPAVASLYPDYSSVVDRAARWFEVGPDDILLTNGMDEGIFCAAILALRGRADGEGIVVEPAFDVYEACIRALAGHVRSARLRADFTLQAADVLALVTPATRIVYLNDPHNPTGARIPHEVIAAIATGARHALVFVDEAYAEFGTGSFMGRAVTDFGNVLVGRTFAKAYGLAGLRAGALIGSAAVLAPMREIVPPYSLNSYAAEAIVAALEDREYVDDYVAQSAESRAMIHEYCERHALHAFPSEANFVLIRVGDDAPGVVASLAARGIFVRDRSDQPGCEGCIRITAGIVEDTRRVLQALEEVRCAGR